MVNNFPLKDPGRLKEIVIEVQEEHYDKLLQYSKMYMYHFGTLISYMLSYVLICQSY